MFDRQRMVRAYAKSFNASRKVYVAGMSRKEKRATDKVFNAAFLQGLTNLFTK